MMSRLLLLAFLSAPLALHATLSTASDEAAGTAAILEVTSRMEAAWNRGDFRGYMDGFANPDVIFISRGEYQHVRRTGARSAAASTHQTFNVIDRAADCPSAAGSTSRGAAPCLGRGPLFGAMNRNALRKVARGRLFPVTSRR